MSTAKPPRTPLDRTAVLRAAVAIADREGLDAVSMRRVARALGVVPMALYKHVGDKEDLLDGMVAVVIDGFAAPVPAEPPTAWKPVVRDAILAARRGLAGHPWARRAIETRSRRTPSVLRHMEALTSAFLRGGFSPDLTHHAMHALGNRIWGFSPELFDESPAPAATQARTQSRSAAPDPADYPGILSVSADAAARRPGATSCDEDAEFTFALDLLLDAIERLHEAGWSSPR